MSFSFGFNKSEKNGYNPNTNPYIYFSKHNDKDKESFIKYLSSPNHPKFLHLLNPSYDFDFFKQMERSFTIRSKNSSYKFNLDILKETSTTIKTLLQNDPNILEYQLHSADNQNVMLKIEQLYLGQKISISEKEYSLFNQIIYELSINDHISLNIINYGFTNKNDFQIQLDSFHSYIRTKIPQTFTIYTKSNEYKCNMPGIKSSNIIKELLLKNPSLTEYKYDFDDEFGEFKQICDLFNFNFVKLTTDNMNIIKIICEDLQIDVIMKDLDSFIEDYEKRVQTIDDQQTLIETIDDLFDTLYKIKETNVESVKNKIIESNWSKTEENVQELVAFILQVIQTDVSLQPYMADLIEILDKNANEKNKLKILVPFIEKKLLFLFGKNKFISSFIFRLMQKGFIKKDAILKLLKKNALNNKKCECFILFLPELYEIYNNNLQLILKFSNTRTTKFIQSYFPNNIDGFIKMRESGEPDDQLTKSLRYDDIDTFQIIISTNQIDVTNAKIPYNIFDYFKSCSEISYINYSAAYGSLKCFKYLLLNHAIIDSSTFSFAVFGGNIEIVKIVDQKNMSSPKQEVKKPSFSFGGTKRTENIASNIDILFPAIRKHQNDLFDWIFENKFSNIIQITEKIAKLLFKASKNGNSHSIISIIDRGFDFSVFDQITCQKIFQKSAENGFYRLVKFLTIVMKKRLEQFDSLVSIFNPGSSVLFGNISIFELYYQKENKIDMIQVLLKAIEYENLDIVKYIFENFYSIINENKSSVFDSLNKSIYNNTIDIFNYLIEETTKTKTNLLSQNDLIELLSNACNLNKIEIVKRMTDVILELNYENIDFTLPFYNATYSSEGSVELCQFFIDKKVHINFRKLSLQISHMLKVNNDVLDIIIKNATPDAKEIFNTFYLSEAIKLKNKFLVQKLLNESQLYENSLFDAVKTGDIEIVNMILNKNSEPSFINRVSKEGTAINLAVTSNYYEIFKLFLSIPGIDLNLHYYNKVPLVSAIHNFNMIIVNDIFDFYGPENKSIQYQLIEASKEFLKQISSRSSQQKRSYNVIEIYKKLIEYEFLDVNQYYESYSLFSFACEVNQIEIVQKLLKSKRADVNSCSKFGDTPLFNALYNKNIEIAKLLINYDGIDINQKNDKNETALTISVDNEFSELVDLILNNEKFDPIESRLNYSFYISKEKIAKRLIMSKDIDVNYKYIVNTNNNNNNNKSTKNIAATNYAYNNISLVYYMTCSSELELYQTPLYDATQKTIQEKIDLIINHPSFDPVKSLAKESIFLCCRNGNIDIFRKLIKIYNNDVNLANSSNQSLFEVSLNEKKIIEEILNNEKFDMKKYDALSAFYSYISNTKSTFYIIQQIILYDKNHDNLINFKNLLPNGKSFFTAISHANNCISQLFELFISNGADPNIPDSSGVYPLEYAIKTKNLNCINALINSKKIDFSVKLNSANYHSICTLSYRICNIDSILIPKKKDISYLHLAAISNFYPIITTLLQNDSIDINITDSLGETPLFEACRIKNANFIEDLFKRDDLDYKHCNNDGDDALKLSQKMFNNTDVLSPKSKEEYLNCLFKVIKKIPSNINDIPNNNANGALGFRLNFRQ